MVMRLVLLVIVVIGLVGIFGGMVPSANMIGLFQTLPTQVLTVAYAGEINQISSLLEEFLELKQSRNSDNAEKLAENLDQKINNLQLVKMYCKEEISSLDLAFMENPYAKLQQICPELKNLSFSKVTQLFRQI